MHRKTYRCYLLGNDNRFKDVEVTQGCADDDAALRWTHRVLEMHPHTPKAELWCEGRFVVTQPRIHALREA